jgi:hypothetical protein
LTTTDGRCAMTYASTAARSVTSSSDDDVPRTPCPAADACRATSPPR